MQKRTLYSFYKLLQCRSSCEHINDVVKPFDWTFTTDYKGTLLEKEDKKITVMRASFL